MESPINKQSGFAMLFTVLIVSLILTIAVSISNLTLRQAVLSNLAKDSQAAFSQADAAVECGMYEDTYMGRFPVGTTVGSGTSADAPGTLACGSATLSLSPSRSYTDYLVYVFQNPDNNKPCFSIIFDKTNSAQYSRVQGTGSNICGSSTRRVERSLEVKY
jgi:hypothetical protein